MVKLPFNPLIIWLSAGAVFVNSFVMLVLVFDSRAVTYRFYSYIGSDYPLQMPLPSFKSVQMTYAESVHYGLDGSHPMDVTEWDTVALNPEGVGRVRLGSDQRTFVVVYYHQLHCLRVVQDSFLAPDNPHKFPNNPNHIHHCFNYLRQIFMCESADSLEQGDFLLRNFTSDRFGDIAVCRDWELTFRAATDNHRAWKNDS